MEFQSVEQMLNFALANGVPLQGKPMICMSPQELAELPQRQRFTLGMLVMMMAYGRAIHSDIEFADIASFEEACAALLKTKCSRIAGYYMRQLQQAPDDVVFLEDLGKVPLDAQLRKHTGDGYTMGAFHDLDNPNSLSATGVIVHRRTGKKFKVPNPPLDRFE